MVGPNVGLSELLRNVIEEVTNEADPDEHNCKDTLEFFQTVEILRMNIMLLKKFYLVWMLRSCITN